jgi:hypothetical protein
VVVELSDWSGVSGWGWPSSMRVVRRTVPSCALTKRAPTLASAADAMTLHRMTEDM